MKQARFASQFRRLGRPWRAVGALRRASAPRGALPSRGLRRAKPCRLAAWPSCGETRSFTAASYAASPSSAVVPPAFTFATSACCRGTARHVGPFTRDSLRLRVNTEQHADLARQSVMVWAPRGLSVSLRSNPVADRAPPSSREDCCNDTPRASNDLDGSGLAWAASVTKRRNLLGARGHFV